MNRTASAFLLMFLLPGWVPAVQAQLYSLPADGGDLVGSEEIINVVDQETLADVARQYKIGHVEIRIANPEVEFWLVRPGTQVTLPTRFILPKARRDGLVLNVPEMRLYYFPRACTETSDCAVLTYPVSIGQQDWRTPLGTAKVTAKVPNPTWRPPESIRKEAAANGKLLPAVVPPGPDNPLGAYALYLDLPGYRIHGTNRPFGVGMRVTHGCVRMYPEDIESLFEMIPVGTKVQIVNQPVKFGWSHGTLLMEVHPPLDEDTEGIALLKERALAQLEDIEAAQPFELYGREFLRALDEQRGMPVAISKGDDDQRE